VHFYNVLISHSVSHSFISFDKTYTENSKCLHWNQISGLWTSTAKAQR